MFKKKKTSTLYRHGDLDLVGGVGNGEITLHFFFFSRSKRLMRYAALKMCFRFQRLVFINKRAAFWKKKKLTRHRNVIGSPLVTACNIYRTWLPYKTK